MAFVGIPNIPTDGLADCQSQVFSAVKENVELLTGARGGTSANAAVSKGARSINPIADQNMRQVSAQGATWTGVSGLSAGETVANGADYVMLVKDVQVLADDLAYTRRALNILIKQMKG